MRKVLLLLTIGIVFLSCSSTPSDLSKSSTATASSNVSKYERQAKRIILWDESMPKEQCTCLIIMRGLTVTSYNGIPVNWEWGSMLYIPPGTINLIFDANYFFYNVNYVGKNWPFQWNFKAGEIHSLGGWAKGLDPVIVVWNLNEKIKFVDCPFYKPQLNTDRDKAQTILD